MTPDQFKTRAGAEAALHEQLTANKQTVNEETLQGCLMAAVQIGRKLKLDDLDIARRLDAEMKLWAEYLTVKAELRKRAAKK